MARKSQQLKFSFEPSASSPPVELLTPDDVFELASQDLLANLREGSVLERKPPGIHAQPLADWFSMWANTPPHGGIITIGVADDGAIVGCCALQQEAVNRLEKTGREFCPDARYEIKRLKVTNRDGAPDFVLLIRVFYREDKVVETFKRDAFIRRGDSKYRLSEDEKRELAIDKGQVSLEQEPSNLVFPADFDMEAVEGFVRSVKSMKKLRTDYTAEQILANRHLGRSDGRTFVPNIACALLFANDPQSVIPGCTIRFQRYEGTEKQTGERRNVVRDESFEGRVPEMIVQVSTAIESQLRTFSRLASDGKFYTAPEYPAAAWHEAVVNACVHRSYSLKNMTIFVKMFDDRLVIESPGPFPPLVTPSNIYDVHHRRNFFLMDAMFYLDFVKCENEGTRRMRDEMLAMDLPAPEFEQKEIGNAIVRVTLRNNQEQRKAWIDKDASHIVGELLFSELSSDEKKCINFVAEYGKVKPADVQRITNIKTWHSAKKVLDGLVRKGILRYTSRFLRDPKSHYRLRNGGEE